MYAVKTQSTCTYFAFVSEHGDVVALGRLDVGTHEALPLVRYPARRLGVVRRSLLQHLLAVERKELEVRIAGERVRERHGGADRSARATKRCEMMMLERCVTAS